MATLAKARLETSDIEPLIGTAIHNDKATLLSGELSGAIRDLLEQRGVLLFPKIGFTDEEQVAFTRTLGTVNSEGEDGIYKVTMDQSENSLRDYLRGAFYWHFDGFSSPKPILASLLSAHRLPNDGSGDTEFCNTYAAYDALSDEEKAEFAKLKVIHTFEETTRYWCPEPSYEQLKAWQAMGQFELPLVWNHRSGRKSLVLGCSAAWVVGMAPFESKALLTRLRDFATQPQFVLRHQWSVGDLVIWDNTGTMHHAMPYSFDSGRMMHRTKLEGEEPIAA
jgi:alpha-ketoglutarate-dependent taurine dioxygenase